MLSNRVSFRGWQPDDYAAATGNMPHDTFVGKDKEYYERLIDNHNKVMGKGKYSVSFRGWQPDDYAAATGKMPHDTFVGNDKEYYEELIDNHNKVMGKGKYAISQTDNESNNTRFLDKLKNFFE